MAIDPNVPLSNPELVAAIEASLSQPNEQTRAGFYKALENAQFLLPVTMEPMPGSADADGRVTLETDTQIGLITISDNQGNAYLPAFTDWQALKAWREKPDERTLVVTYEDVAGMVIHTEGIAGFCINAYTHSIPVSREQIMRTAAAQAAPVTVAAGTSVLTGTPAEDPIELKAAVSQYLLTQPHVRRAWLVLMSSGNDLSLLIVVDHSGDNRQTFNGIASVAVPMLQKGQVLDFTPADSELGKQIANEQPPFYER